MPPATRGDANSSSRLLWFILEGGQRPQKGSHGAAGYDLYSAEGGTVCPFGRKRFGTQVCVMLPAGHYGRVAPRSGLAWDYGLDVLAGVIDADYRGAIQVVLHNTDPAAPYEVKKGDRIAQLIVERVFTGEDYEAVEQVPAPAPGNAGISAPVAAQEPGPVTPQGSTKSTERGVSGFGSTGT